MAGYAIVVDIERTLSCGGRCRWRRRHAVGQV